MQSKMKVSLEELYKGKATKIKDNEYFTSEQYCSPFVERIKKFCKEINIYVKPSDQVTLTRDGNINFEDVLYNRVWIQGITNKIYKHKDLQETINMAYALDTRKPIVKFYVGALYNNNFVAFNPNKLSIAEIKPETAINFTVAEKLLNVIDETDAELVRLNSKVFSKDEIIDNLGKMIDNCINKKYNNDFGLIKLPESMPIEAFKDIFYDEKSNVYKKENQASLLDIYNAFSNILTNDNKDFINRFEKTLLIDKIINI